MDIGNIFIIIGAILLPIIGCWFGMFAIRYSVVRLKPGNQKSEALKVLTSTFVYVSAILWTIICAGLGYASYRVFDYYRSTGNGFNGTATAALILYLIQLILFWSWMPVFIKYEQCIGLIVWFAALFTSVGCAIVFGIADLIAGLIFIPYIIYMLFFSASLSGILCIACSMGIIFDCIDSKTKNVNEQSDEI